MEDAYLTYAVFSLNVFELQLFSVYHATNLIFPFFKSRNGGAVHVLQLSRTKNLLSRLFKEFYHWSK